MEPAAPEVPTLESLYAAHYRDLVRLAALLVDDSATAEEIVQDAFVRWYRRPPAMRDPAAVPGYLRRMVVNGARSELRRRGVRRRLRPVPDPTSPAAVAAVTGPEHGAVLDDDARAVLAALDRLPERQRTVVVLRYWAELSEAEIAETMGVAAGTVKSHAHRALAALEDLLEERR